MTPKEKAKQLVEDFLPITNHRMYSNKYAKLSAIICVEEILKLPCLTDEGWLNVPDTYKVQYWNKVKKEIERS